MLNDPNIDSPANLDAALEMRDNFDAYKKKVRKLTQQSVDSLWKKLLRIELYIKIIYSSQNVLILFGPN